jgi:hypothetical protein
MMRRFAWYGRLSTKDKQDPTLSFPSQREACASKAEELGGEIVCEFTDQEAGGGMIGPGGPTSCGRRRSGTLGASMR